MTSEISPHITQTQSSIVGFVQARLGSERVRYKNLRMVGTRPLVAYGVETLLRVPEVQEVYINTESTLIAEVCKQYGAKWYHRGSALASSTAQTDDWVADFLENIPCDLVVVVNPCVVFLKPSTVSHAIQMLQEDNYDTVISGTPIRTHVIYNGKPLNFQSGDKLPRTQDLSPLYALNFGVAVWRSKLFLASYHSRGVGVLSGRIGVIETADLEGLDVDTEMDLQIVDALASADIPLKPRYHSYIEQASMADQTTGTGKYIAPTTNGVAE